MAILILILGLCASVFGFTSNLLSRRTLVFTFVVIACSFNVAQFFLSHNYWMIGDQCVALTRSILAFFVLKGTFFTIKTRWQPFLIGGIFGGISLILTLGIRETVNIVIPLWMVFFLIVSTTIATAGFYTRNVLAMKIMSLASYVPWVIVLVIRGLYGNLLGSFLSCSLLVWSLIEIYRARRREVPFEEIEQANFPWKIRHLRATRK